MSTESTVTDEQLAADQHAFDAKLAAQYSAWEKATDARDRAWNQIHEAVGDRQSYQGRRRAWRRTHAEAEQAVRQMAAAGAPLPSSMSYRQTPGDLLVNLRDAEAAVTGAALAVQQMEAIYSKNPWPRYFPCQNRDGHIHSSFRACPSVRWDTAMAWRPDLSGLTVDEAVADLGPALCSICFASAPVEQKSMTLGQVADERTRAERDAARAAREAVKAAKQLAGDEVFRVVHDRIETVAACLEVLRKEVEFRDYYGRGPHPWHQPYVVAAEKAAAVLAAREAKHEGWGRTQEQIGKTIDSAVKRNRKLGARI